MAAAEYFDPGGGQGQSYPSGPQPGPSSYNGGNLTPQNPPYPMSDAPPPYSAFSEQRPHSQPPPPHRPTGSNDIYRPAPPPANNSNGYPPEKSSRPPNQMNDYYQYQQQQQQYQQYPPPPPQQSGSWQQQPGGYFPTQQQGGSAPQVPQVRFDDRKNSTTPLYRPSNSPYRESERDRSRSRSRSRDRQHRKHHHHHHRPEAPKKKPSGASTFLGAGGGAILGDAIFPGLGTLGGALLGGLGGHEYAKEKSKRAPAAKKHRSYSNDMDDADSGSYFRRDDYSRDDRRGRKY